NFQIERDLPASAGLPGLELVRHYNSLDTRSGATGTGWVLSYDTRLHRVAPGWQIVQADGSRVSFPASSEEAGVFKSRHGELRKMRNSYYWYWPGGALLEFDEQGWLISLHQPGNATV